MRVEIQQEGAYAVAYVKMGVGEQVDVEADGMFAASHGVEVSAGFGARGVGGAIKRHIMAQETFFTATYHARLEGAWVGVAPKMPGDVVATHLAANETMILEQGAYLASETTVDLDVRWAGLRSVIGKEGATHLKATGPGMLVFASYGGVRHFDLDADMTMLVDTGHLVAWSETCGLTTGALSGPLTAAMTGEGLVVEVTGPGRVWIQTRAERALKRWLLPERKQNDGR